METILALIQILIWGGVLLVYVIPYLSESTDEILTEEQVPEKADFFVSESCTHPGYQFPGLAGSCSRALKETKNNQATLTRR